MKKGLTGLMVFILSFLMAAQPVFAARTREDIARDREKAQQEQKNTQSQYNEAQGKLGDLEAEQEALQEEIDELDAQLVEVIASVSLMEELIEETKIEIQKAQEEYDAAKDQEEAQYEAMKKRLRYLYEKGEANYVEAMSRAVSWGDMLNQAGYVEKLYEYDARMLQKYIALKEEVAAKQEQLEEKQSDLDAQHFELEEEKSAMEEMMAEKKALSADYENQIAHVRQEAAVYKAQIKQQNAQLAALQEEENAIIRAEEERRKAEEAARQAAQGQSSSAGSQGTVAASSGGLKTIPPATGSTGADIAKYACQFVGNPYVAGGTSLVNGADCSGFVMAVYKQYGYSLPRNSTAQRSAGREVSYADAQPGDIICYSGHVAIYLGGGRIVHASTAKTGIKYGYANYRPILTVRRIVG